MGELSLLFLSPNLVVWDMSDKKLPDASPLLCYNVAVNFNRNAAYERYLASKADGEYRAMRRRLGLDPPLPNADESINEARIRAGFPPMK